MAVKRLLQITLILAVLAACLVGPRSVSAGSGPCGSTYYVIQPGDWLSTIAARYGITLAALDAANPVVAAQQYIYPGQVLIIPDGTCPGTLPVPAPYVPLPPGVLPTYYYPSISVAPHVGDSYYRTPAQVGATLTFEARVKNNGDIPLQVVANLSIPSNLGLGEVYNDCPDSLGVGSTCTFYWQLTPKTSGQTYVRVYARGLYGNYRRAIASSAYFFDVK